MRKFCGLCTISVLTLLLSGGAPGFAQTFSIYDEAPRPPGSIPSDAPQAAYPGVGPRSVYPDAAPRSIYDRVMQEPLDDSWDDERDDKTQLDRSIGEDNGAAEVPAQFRRQVVSYPTREAAGTIVIDTPHAYLYYVLGGGLAIRYGIGVGREGFTWSGSRKIERKSEWPDWIPPSEMIDRQPYLPRTMAGGPGNPLGARAMYLAGTLYRIHGTSEPESIGRHVSSGCIRMLNEDVIDLYNRAPVGTKVVVLPDAGRHITDAGTTGAARMRAERAAD